MNLTDLFLKLFAMSLTASYCILFICIARLFLRRAPKLFSYLLWSIVAVRLICPVAFESNFSFMGKRLLAFADRIEAGSNYENGMTAKPSAELPSVAEEQQLLHQPFGTAESDIYRTGNTLSSFPENPSVESLDTGLHGLEDAGTSANNTGKDTGNSHVYNSNPGNGADASNVYNAASGSALDTSNIYNADAGSAPDTSNIYNAGAGSVPIIYTDNPDTAGNALSGGGSDSLRTIAAAAARIWLVGMLGLFGYCAVSYLRLHRRLAEKAVYSCHYRGIPVYEVPGLDTPFVAGFCRPVIYLPTDLEIAETYPCLAHEYTHICRKDYLVKQSAFLLACVYWFQPLIWLAYHLMSRDMEMSCDEMTLRNADLADRKAYSNALVRLSCKTRHISGRPLAFSEKNTASRIRNILTHKKPASRVLIPCAVLLSVFAAGLLTDPAGGSVRAGEPAGTAGFPGVSRDTDSFSAGIAAKASDIPAALAATGNGQLLYDPPRSLAGISQTPAPADSETDETSDIPMEDPYPALIQKTCQELQDACRKGDTEKVTALRLEAKSLMTSYWTALIKEQRDLQNEFDHVMSDLYSDGPAEDPAGMPARLQLLDASVNQAKAEMNHMDKTMDAIEGIPNVIKTAAYETSYSLNGVLTTDSIVRSLPKDSAPEIDILSAGDTVSIISFGKYMLREDENFKDFFLSDAEILQEYHNFAVILYHSDEGGRKTTRKGYINMDSLDISGNTAETYMYWIGKTWSEAFCSQDGITLYQMAADRNAFTDWIYIDSVQDADPVQVSWNTSIPCAQFLYRVNLLTAESPDSRTAAGSYDIALQFFVQTPESAVWTQRQDLKLSSSARQLQGIRHISDLLNSTVRFSEVRNYEQITGFLAYQDAYLTDCSFGPSYFDFVDSGYADLYNPGRTTLLENMTMSEYMTTQVETLAEKYLNLSGGRPNADTLTMRLRKDDRITGLVQLAYVEYTFARADTSGEDRISVPMYYDDTNEYWCIWMPGQNEEIDDAMRKMQENLMQYTP